jgi:phage I-like protein
LNARADGVFGSVEWTEPGKQLLKDKAYRGISPVFQHRPDGTITRLLRASLTNVPNLRELTALNAEDPMDKILKSLLAALGLKEDATEEAALNAVKALKDSTALQAALKPIAKAAGCKDDADATAIAAAVTTLATTAAGTGEDGKAIEALQAELTTVTTQFNALKTGLATERATAFVDGAIQAGRVGVKPLRDHYIAMHAADPARVQKEIEAMPVLGPSGARVTPPEKDKDGKVALNAEQQKVCKLLGLKPDDYAKTLAAEAAEEEAA